MATLMVRNVDDDVKTELRKRAAVNGRSLEAEVRAVLKDAVSRRAGPASGAELLARIRSRVESVGGVELDLPPRGPGREPPDLG